MPRQLFVQHQVPGQQFFQAHRQPQQQVFQPAVSSFDDSDPKFFLWCCHIRKWALVFAIIGLVSFIGLLVLSIVSAVIDFGAEDGVFIVSCLISICALYMAMCGIQKEIPILLIPQIVIQVLDTIGIIGKAIYLFTLAGDAEIKPPVARAVGVILVVILPINVFIIYVFISCYLYLKAKREWSERIASTPVTMKMVNANGVQTVA